MPNKIAAYLSVCVFCFSGVQWFCSFNQSDPCYAALQDKLSLQMVLEAQDQDLYLYKQLISGRELEVFRVKNNEEKTYKSISNRSEYINGTLIINSVSEADSGTYTIELYDSLSTRTFVKHLRIDIEGTVSLSPYMLKVFPKYLIFIYMK